jgi:hypothetical protein
MTDRDPESSRTLLSMQALRWRALAEIRPHSISKAFCAVMTI